MPTRARHFLFLLLACAVSGFAYGQGARDYPSKAIRIVIPFAPGGGTDTLTRIVAQKMSEAWGQPVVADNRPGAGGTLASDIVAKSAPDGYTLLMGMIATHAMSPHLYKNLTYDAIRDFAPVTLAVVSPNILVVHPSVPATSIGELIAFARANPGKLNYGSAGTGSPAHLAGELLKSLAKVDVVHVPYKGGAPAVTALMAGEVSMMFAGPIESLPQVRSGKLRALGVTTPKRYDSARELPTMLEAGLAGFELTQWNGLFAPAGTPPEVVAKLNAEATRVLGLDDVKERLLKAVFEPAPSTSKEFADFVKRDYDRWGAVIRSAGIRLD